MQYVEIERTATMLAMERHLRGVLEWLAAPMFDEGLRERRYPTQPNHEQQAYRTKQPADT